VVLHVRHERAGGGAAAGAAAGARRVVYLHRVCDRGTRGLWLEGPLQPRLLLHHERTARYVREWTGRPPRPATR